MPFNDDDTLSIYDVVEDFFPYDGPHNRDSVVAAAGMISRLGRYLNNATQPHIAEHTLEWASAIGDIVNSLHATVVGFDQLLGQLTHALHKQGQNPTLYDATRADRDPREAVAHGTTTLEAAREPLKELADLLGTARLSRLGNNI
jgi:hypothetical protein